MERIKEPDKLKSKFNLRIETFSKTNEGLESINQEWISYKRKKFYKDLEEEKTKGISHSIEICNVQPEKFQFNTVYIRADGKAAYVYVLKED